MKRFLKYLFVVIGALLGLALVVMAVLNVIALNRLNQRYEVTVEPIQVPGSEDARARGEHLVQAVSACTSCHGPDLGGREFLDTPIVGQIYAPNLTSGEGGKASQYRSEDWVRVMRHGVDPSGRPLFFMPAQYYRHYNEADLGAIVAYLQSVPPVDRETPPTRLSLTGRVLFALGALEELPAEIIERADPPAPAPRPDVSPEYGEFLVTVAICKSCHGENLGGGQVGPDDPLAPNLTPGGELAGWTEEDFFTLIRSGIHPSGRAIDPVMPWQSYNKMTDSELKAIWAYLQELPALPANE